jgi:nucleoside phosphorylase
MSNITLFAATDLEFRAFASMMDRWQPSQPSIYLTASGIGWYGENRIEIFRTEMGPINAAAQAAEALSRSESRLVLISGLAGGLAPECQSGDLVLYRQCHFIENKGIVAGTADCDRNLTGQLRERLEKASFRVHEGDGLTLPRLICRTDEKREAGKSFKAIAVDMESYQIMRIAEQAGRPSAVLRVISDDLRHDLPDINSALDSQLRVNYFKMVRNFCVQPILAARFLVNIRRSLQHLKLGLRSVLKAAMPELSKF